MFLKNVTQTLSKHSVNYAIAGGYAVSFHGAVRTTFDIDIVVELELENLENCVAALTALDLQSRVPVTTQEIFHFRHEYIQKRSFIEWSFVNATDPSQIVDIVLTHDLATMTKKNIVVSGASVPVLSAESLIKMKRASGRPQDIEDFKALERLN